MQNTGTATKTSAGFSGAIDLQAYGLRPGYWQTSLGLGLGHVGMPWCSACVNFNLHHKGRKLVALTTVLPTNHGTWPNLHQGLPKYRGFTISQEYTSKKCGILGKYNGNTIKTIWQVWLKVQYLVIWYNIESKVYTNEADLLAYRMARCWPLSHIHLPLCLSAQFVIKSIPTTSDSTMTWQLQFVTLKHALHIYTR